MRIAASIILAILFSFNAYSQIEIPDIGDGWKNDVDSAIQLIKDTDTAAYRILMDNCKIIEFIISDHSSTKLPHTIAITVSDMKIGSINNIACLLVHESYHLYLSNFNLSPVNPDKEEYLCYLKEYEFMSKLAYVEDWLFINTFNKLLHYKAEMNKQKDK